MLLKLKTIMDKNHHLYSKIEAFELKKQLKAIIYQHLIMQSSQVSYTLCCRQRALNIKTNVQVNNGLRLWTSRESKHFLCSKAGIPNGVYVDPLGVYESLKGVYESPGVYWGSISIPGVY
jgi:hypothetical protein